MASREILILYSDTSDRVVRLILRELQGSSHPISTRNLRWWTGNTKAFRYILTVGIPTAKIPLGPNCIPHVYEGYAPYYKELQGIGQDPVPMAAYQEKEAAKIVKQIQSWLQNIQ